MREAREAASGAAAAIVFVGNHPLVNGKETIDRPGLELSEAQRRLIRETAAANANTIVVIVGSYPFALGEEKELAKAVLYTSHAGPELGNAIADVLFGAVSPAGRLNMTWHRSVEQLPDIMEYDLIRGGRTYRYFDGEPEFPFGHGLTYARIRYEELRLESRMLERGCSVGVEVILRNESEIDSDEVVQLYGSASSSRVKRPLRQLLAFKRVFVPAGSTVAVSLRIAAEDLAFWDVTRERWCVETADWTLGAGPSSADRRLEATLAVVGEIVPPRNLTERTLAMNYDDYSFAYLDECVEGGSAVVAKASGAWLKFADADFAGGTARFEARISGSAGGRIGVRLAGPDGIVEFVAAESLAKESNGVAAFETFENSSGKPNEAAAFETWRTVSCSVAVPPGRYDVTLTIDEGLALSWFRFVV